MSANELRAAQLLHANLGLAQNMYPVRRFGNKSSFGKVFETNGNKIMKISPWSKNSEREMKISKIASNANVGPRVHNTRIWTPRTPKNANHLAILESLAPNRSKNKLSVITMDKVPRAKSLYNAINNGTVTNWKLIESAIRRMHAAGIHHGNLHGGNILVYMNNSGQLKLVPINFGASKYSREIKNTNSAVQHSIQRFGYFRGPGICARDPSGTKCYLRPGRNQPVRSNANMMVRLKAFFNSVQKKRLAKAEVA